jgi:hypothetical protein
METDGHIRFYNTALPCYSPQLAASWCWLSRLLCWGGNTIRRFDVISIELDHETRRCLGVRLGAGADLIEDMFENVALLTLIASMQSHVTVHLSAAQIRGALPTWPLAKEALRSVTGLGYAGLNIAGAYIAGSKEQHVQMAVSNAMQPIPHMASAEIHHILHRGSATYRMMRRAHAHPLLQQAAGNDPVVCSSIVHGSLLHGLDRFLADVYTPWLLSSRTLGGEYYPFAVFRHQFPYGSDFAFPETPG